MKNKQFWKFWIQMGILTNQLRLGKRRWTHRATDGPPGAVRQPYQNGNAQRNQTQILHFCKATAKPNF